MPLIKINTNVAVDKSAADEVLKAFSQLLAQETGKPERYVMVGLESGQAMLFGGSDAPLAYIECKSIGLSRSQINALADSVCKLVDKLLKIAPERVYIEFTDCPAASWGWNGSTFG